MYTLHKLNISGRRSTGFYGEEIASTSNRDSDEKHSYEWDAVRVYEIDPEWSARQYAKNGKRMDPYRVGIAKCTVMEGDRDRYRVFYAKTIAQVLDIVRSQIPEFHREIEDKLRLTNHPTGALEDESRRRNPMVP